MTKKKTKKYTTSGVEILHDLFVRDDPEMKTLIQNEREKASVAEYIYQMRIREGLTQKQLAERIGTTPSVISRLEDANYEGHSMKMLNKIADALGCRINVEFRKEEPVKQKENINWNFSFNISMKSGISYGTYLFAA